jgi:4-carboxymuconolactone decarboxylase
LATTAAAHGCEDGGVTDERQVGEAYERGLATRREVLGADYVERALNGADDFTWPLQQMTTEVAWDGIWNRPGLDRRSRSLVTLGMLVALNRPAELRVHVKAALTNGVTKGELREVLLQAVAYCGIPAAGDAFRIAHDVLAELDL